MVSKATEPAEPLQSHCFFLLAVLAWATARLISGVAPRRIAEQFLV